jgi:hypothetical protein
MIRIRLFSLLYFFWLFFVFSSGQSEEVTCNAEDGTCPASSTVATTTSPTGRSNDDATSLTTTSQKHQTRSIRFFSQTSYCSSTTKDLYQHSGSAQAYRPNAVVSSTVCPKSMANDVPYKVSSWPLLRHSSGKGTAPIMDVTLHLWSCRPKKRDDGDEKVTACACSPLTDASSGHHNNLNNDMVRKSATVEVWHAQPDGRYTSLHSKDDNCRATVPVNDQGDVKFSTVAPGSTGMMAGLGPWGWDSSPYGPPVMHILVHAPYHNPLLLDLPILVHPKTLEERPFSLASLDWRGLSWSKHRKGPSLPYKLMSWTVDAETNHIDMKVNIFLELLVDQNDNSTPPKPDFCPSWYLLPGSFFLEPISVCARYLLDFFQL